MLTTPVYSYLDAGTVSIVLQGLLAALATAIVSISLFWQKIRNLLFGDKKKGEGEEQTEGREQDWQGLSKVFLVQTEIDANRYVFILMLSFERFGVTRG